MLPAPERTCACPPLPSLVRGGPMVRALLLTSRGFACRHPSRRRRATACPTWRPRWGAGRDKAAHDAFTVFDLGRAQIEAMYRGDWLARKVVDIVPYWLGSSKGSSDRADQITAMLHQTLGGGARTGRART